MIFNPLSRWVISWIIRRPSTLVDLSKVGRSKLVTYSYATDNKDKKSVLKSVYLGDVG